MSLSYIAPIKGHTYTNSNGSIYLCVGPVSEGRPGCDMTAWFERQSDGWTLKAHGILQHEDGRIEWNYSTDGHWPKFVKKVFILSDK